MLVYFQRITGQSYQLWNFNQRMGLSLKLVLIFLNSILFAATLFFFYIFFQDVQEINKNREFSFPSHKSLMSYIMQISLYTCYAIINVYVFLLMFFKGKAILVFLYDMDINIDSKIEEKIAIKAIILQVSLTLTVTLSFSLSLIIFYGIQNKILKNLINLMVDIITSNNLLCLLSIMAYFCYIIQKKLAVLQNKFTSLNQLPAMFKNLLIIQNYVRNFDAFYNKYLFCVIVLWSFECISSLTTLYFDRFQTMVWPIEGIMESLLLIFLFCYLSNIMYQGYMNIINRFEHLQLSIHENNLGHFNHCLVIRLYSLRDDMCFTAFNLYPINMKTFMSILSVITFTVILVQTRD